MAITPSSLWTALALRLRIRVTAPFALTDSTGAVHQFDALFHDFGAPNGMLLFADWDDSAAKAAIAAGYGFSCVSPSTRPHEDETDMFRDWGWAGAAEQRPAWCTPLPSDDDDAR